MRVAVRVGILIFARRVEVELLAVGEAAVLVAADLAVAVERNDLPPVEVRIVFDELARLCVFRIVAVLDFCRAVVDLLHEMERQCHPPAGDLAASDACRIAVIILAEMIDAVRVARHTVGLRIVEVAVVQGKSEVDILALADVLRRRIRACHIVRALNGIVFNIKRMIAVRIRVRRTHMVDVLRRRLDICRAVVRFFDRIGLKSDIERTARKPALRDVARTVQRISLAARRSELRAVVRQIVVRCLRRLRPRADNLDVLVVDALLVDVGILIFRRIASCACAVQIAAFAALPAACDVEKRLGLLDRLRTIVLLRGRRCRQRQRGAVDLVVRG